MGISAPHRLRRTTQNMKEITAEQVQPPLVTLKIDPAAPDQELHKLVGQSKAGWTGSDNLAYAKAIISRLETPEGTPPSLKQEHELLFEVLFANGPRIQERLLERVFSESGYALDKGAKDALAMLFNVNAFGEKLAKSTNPKTGAKFITKEGRQKRKRGFDNFIDTQD